jgi:hypothetical protein
MILQRVSISGREQLSRLRPAAVLNPRQRYHTPYTSIGGWTLGLGLLQVLTEVRQEEGDGCLAVYDFA